MKEVFFGLKGNLLFFFFCDFIVNVKFWKNLFDCLIYSNNLNCWVYIEIKCGFY